MNLTKEEASYNRVKEVLIKIKLEKEEKGEELFYVNLLLEEIRVNFLSDNTSQIDFKDALKVVESFTVN